VLASALLHPDPAVGGKRSEAVERKGPWTLASHGHAIPHEAILDPGQDLSAGAWVEDCERDVRVGAVSWPP
jgi:hypothetical protein